MQIIFKVYPVQMVSGVSKPKREKGGSRQHKPQTGKSPSFGALLERALEDNCGEECCSVTYDSKSRLQTYYYHPSREYTY